jgi:hypothetical protein
MKLEQLYALDKEAIDAIKLPFEVRKSRKDLELAIIKIEQEIAEKDLKIQDAKGARPFNLDTILDAIDDKALLERKLKQANELMEELF